MFKNLKEKGAKLGLGSSENAPASGSSDKGQDLRVCWIDLSVGT